MIFPRMCSTDAEDMFPASASERRLISMALSGSLRLCWAASMTFGPPGWHTQLLMSSTVSPCSARKAVTLPPSSRSTTSGSSAVRMIRNLSALSRQPSMSPLPGYTWLRDAMTRGPRAACPVSACPAPACAPLATRAAAPSPNRLLATRSATVISVGRHVSEQSSIDSSAAVCCGQASR